MQYIFDLGSGGGGGWRILLKSAPLLSLVRNISGEMSKVEYVWGDGLLPMLYVD